MYLIGRENLYRTQILVKLEVMSEADYGWSLLVGLKLLTHLKICVLFIKELERLGEPCY